MTEPSTLIITGAAQGIGRAVALRSASGGARVAVWDTQSDGGEETARLCREAGVESGFWRVDVGDEAQVKAAAADVKRRWGTPCGLVNNAGIYPRASALEMDIALWEQVLRVNLGGTFLCARTVAKSMIEAGRGAIVNMASGRALAGAANGSHYAASKAGIVALTKSLALEWAPYGIRVNCVIPGITDTAQPRGEMSDEQLNRVGSSIPLGRIGRPEDIAAVVAFLLGGDSSYMTGQSVAVNGGAIMIP